MGVVVITVQYGRTTSKLLATVLDIDTGRGLDQKFSNGLVFEKIMKVETVMNRGPPEPLTIIIIVYLICQDSHMLDYYQSQ